MMLLFDSFGRVLFPITSECRKRFASARTPPMLAKISTGVIALNGRDMADDPKLLAVVSSEKQAEICSILWLILTGKGSGQKKAGLLSKTPEEDSQLVLFDS
jgi:hypothetical protein